MNKLIYLVFGFAITAPFIVNYGVLNYHIKSGGIDQSWISFWGSYLGGIFTLIAVWWTITASKASLEVARKANEITIIKNEKDLIYQMHKDARQYLSEIRFKEIENSTEEPIKGLHAIRFVKENLENLFDSDTLVHWQSIDRFNKFVKAAHEAMSIYQLPITAVSIDLDNIDIESENFLVIINATMKPIEITELCEMIEGKAAIINKMPKELMESGNKLLELAIKINSFSNKTFKHLEERATND